MVWTPETTEADRAADEVYIGNGDVRITIGDRVERITSDVKCGSGRVTGFASNGYAHVLLDNEQSRIWACEKLRVVRPATAPSPASIAKPVAPAPAPAGPWYDPSRCLQQDWREQWRLRKGGRVKVGDLVTIYGQMMIVVGKLVSINGSKATVDWDADTFLSYAPVPAVVDIKDLGVQEYTGIIQRSKFGRET